MAQSSLFSQLLLVFNFFSFLRLKPFIFLSFGAPPPFSSWTWDQAMAELPPFCHQLFTIGAPPHFSSWTWDQAMAELPPFCHLFFQLWCPSSFLILDLGPGNGGVTTFLSSAFHNWCPSSFLILDLGPGNGGVTTFLSFFSTLVPLLLSHPGLGTRQWWSYHPPTQFSSR